ncbi:EF-hand domain-containing protein [Nonomuraea sp. NPDC050536]|uniref:EF-hand domain-containing protein n=1 Tax=Nonomuraea sp. NPDC050536 TaxID=3364366 RepID=UPI0037C94A0A
MTTPIQERKLARHFELLDYDRDGYIEQSDMKMFAERICQAAGVAPTAPKGRKVMQQADMLWEMLHQSMDHDRDHQVSREEFVDAADMPSVMTEAIKLGIAAFEVMDQDGDGKISMAEWTKMDQRLGVDPAESRKGFGQLDKDNDGHLTKAEFTKGVEEFYRSDNASAPGNWAFGKF